MLKKSDFQIMDEMSSNDEDINMTPHFVSARTAKGGGHVTMGVDAATLNNLVLEPEKYLVALYLINKEQYLKRKG